jgi:protein involved in polysaccharide export with SLBB domain
MTPVPADYVIGPGDELRIRIWGQVNLTANERVDRSGEIYLPQVGPVHVAGLPFSALDKHLSEAIGRVYRNFNLTVDVGQIRAIQVYVAGEARRPGVYTVSSLSTLVDTLFASGGPGVEGSMRSIELRRGEAVVTRFDLYDLLIRGDKSKDAKLQQGDIIFIPPVGPQAAVFGSVRNPAIYELQPQELLSGLLADGGGVSAVAAEARISIERIDEHRDRHAMEVAYDAAGMALPMADGDIVRVYSIVPKYEKTVILRGNTANPGRFAWHSGMRISDLIPDKESLITRNYWWKRAQLGLPVPEFEPAPSFTDMRQAAPEIDWDYAVVERLDADTLKSTLIPFDLGKLVLQHDASQDFDLQAGDAVTVFSQAEIQVPLAEQNKRVKLDGEIVHAGVYMVQPGETLRQLVERAGGFTPNAYLFASEFTRVSTRAMQQARIDEYLQSLSMRIQRNDLAAAPQQVSTAGASSAAIQSSGQNLLASLRQIRATGRIVLALRPDSSGVDSLPNIALEDGDRFVVPFVPAAVNVVGAVNDQNSFLFKPGSHVGAYLRLAGGQNKDADRRREFIIRADGEVVSREMSTGPWGSEFNDLHIYPGDTIVVPEKLPKVSALYGVMNWSQMFSQFALGAAALDVVH